MMKSFTVWTLLFLTFLATSRAYMGPLMEGEDENEDHALDETDDTPGKMGERCGTTRPCAPGLDCIRMPIRHKCMPVSCGVQALRETIADAGFDLHGYGQTVMNDAGVTMDSKMFRQFPDPTNLNLFNQDSDDFTKLEKAVLARRPPLEYFASSFNNCTGGQFTDSKASVAGLTPYAGIAWGLGALGTYNGDLFWGRGSTDNETVGILNNCFGFVLGYDAEISGLLGLAFTGRLADLEDGCKQMFPIADFPPFGLQIGFIAAESPTFLMEFTGGASASAGLPGYTSCTTTAI